MEVIVPKQRSLPFGGLWDGEWVWERLPEESCREVVILYARLTVRAAQEEATGEGEDNEQQEQ